MPQMKTATCCYCGSTAALVLRGQMRHELSCQRCGAPLSRLKRMPVRSGQAPAPAATPARPATPGSRDPMPARPVVRGKAKRRKRPGRRFLEEAWDFIEDILD